MAGHTSTDEGQYVVFELDGESYGVDISRVQEIDRPAQVTTVPEAPAFVEGVINLRGRIAPVVNLRSRFGLPAAGTTAQTRIVVIKAGEDWVGLIVDAVLEVLSISAGAIVPPPAMATSAASTFLQGIARHQERLMILLDLDQVLERSALHDLAVAGVMTTTLGVA